MNLYRLVAYVSPIQIDLARGRIEESFDEMDSTRLSSSTSSHERDVLAVSNLE